MNIFYEESGQFKVASIVQKNDSTYQVDTQHGKRVKVKAAHVFVEFDDDMTLFLNQAEAAAAEIDVDLLWEVCGDEEFSAQSIGEEYFGRAPNKQELAAVLMALYAAPMYFYKKAKGIFKAAPEETLKQALAALERKKEQERQMQVWSEELKNGHLPDAIAADLKIILHAPDKQSLTYKTFSKTADALKITPYELAKRVGGVSSLSQYLFDGFCLQHFPNGTVHRSDLPLTPIGDWPLAEGVYAFSLDDESTTEIDDALSVQDLTDGIKRVGIHIAAPSTAMGADNSLWPIVLQRQSTVYYPGGKITMLPDDWVAQFSLHQGIRPALSIYFDVDADFNATFAFSRLERVEVAENLRIQNVEPHFNHETGLAGECVFPYHAQLRYLYQLALERQKQRDRYEPERMNQYDYNIDLDAEGKIKIIRRQRGSPIDVMISEMMILANSQWAKMLDEANLPAIFRVQAPMGKVRMSTRAEPHSGMNLSHYGWLTSPLRRASDCINQMQLLSLIDSQYPLRFEANSPELFAALRDFEATYAAYADFQREMESYWSLVYIEQEDLNELEAVLLKEDLLRIEGLPLVARAVGVPLDLPPKTRIKVQITGVDAEKQFLSLKYVAALL